MSNQRPIDAYALLESLGEEPLLWNDTDAEIQERSDYLLFKKLIQDAPTISIDLPLGSERSGDPRAHFEGNLIEFYYKCSGCGIYIMTYKFTPHCPECGAAMKCVTRFLPADSM